MYETFPLTLLVINAAASSESEACESLHSCKSSPFHINACTIWNPATLIENSCETRACTLYIWRKIPKDQRMPNSPDPEKWKLTDSVYAKKSTTNVNIYWQVGLILLHICLMLEAAFILALGTNLQFGPTSGIVRMFIGMFLPNAPTVTVELINGVLVVSYHEIIAIGVLLTICFAIGLIISCFGSKKALKIYALLLGIIILGLIIATAITFGKQNYLSDKALLYMSENLETYKNNYHDKNLMAVAIWNTVMREGSHFCCGLAGYKDFEGSTRMPASCCSVDNQEEAESCKYTTAAAMKPLVPGCVEKITFYVNLSEPSLAVAPVSFIVPPVIVLIVVICAALC